MLEIAERAGASWINRDRMWHYTEGIQQLEPGLAEPRDPDPPRSVVAVARRDSAGRCRRRTVPGFDTLGTLAQIRSTGYDYSWFVLNQPIIAREFALSGSEQNPDITGKDVEARRSQPLAAGAPGAGRGVQATTARTSSWPTTSASSSPG